MKKQEKNAAPEPDEKQEPRTDMKKLDLIDFAKLDLTIEKVEERIAPSETNVFDK